MSISRDVSRKEATCAARAIVGTHCCNSGNRSNFLNTWLQQLEHKSLLDHIVATVGIKIIVGTDCCKKGNRGHCWLTVTLDIIVAFDAIVAFVILFE
jgi:hypothetical protein